MKNSNRLIPSGTDGTTPSQALTLEQTVTDGNVVQVANVNSTASGMRQTPTQLMTGYTDGEEMEQINTSSAAAMAKNISIVPAENFMLSPLLTPRLSGLSGEVKLFAGEVKLFAAIIGGNLDKVQQVIEQEYVDVNAKTLHFVSPIRAAVENGKLEMVKYLAERPDIKLDGDNNIQMLLDVAITRGHMNVIKYLVREQHANVSAATTQTIIAPLFTALLCENQEIIKYLIDVGADVYNGSHTKHSFLHHLYNGSRTFIWNWFSSEEKIEILFHIFNQGKNIFYSYPGFFDMFQDVIIYHSKEPKNLQKAVQPFLFYEETDQYCTKYPLNLRSKKILTELFNVQHCSEQPGALEEQLKNKLLEELNSISNDIIKDPSSKNVTLETLIKSPIQSQVKLLSFYGETSKLYSNRKSAEAKFRENKFVPQSLKISTDISQKAIGYLLSRFMGKSIAKYDGHQDGDNAEVLRIFKKKLSVTLEFEILKYLDFDSVKDTCKRYIEDYKKQKAESDAVLHDSIMSAVEYHAADVDMVGEHNAGE